MDTSGAAESSGAARSSDPSAGFGGSGESGASDLDRPHRRGPAMDYYAGTGTEMGQGAISAARATLAQMQSVDSGYTYANLGITPMIGKNDDGSTFTLADAQTVENFAAQNSVGRLAFWAITRDQACGGSANSLPTCSQISQNSLAFTDAFVPYEGSSGGGGTGTDFSLALSPGSASVVQGGSATAAVSTAVTSGSAESVGLAASGAPSGLSVSFSPNSVNSGGSSTLTATVGSSVAAGTYPITVTGTAASGSHSTTYTLTVTTTGGGGGGGALTNAGFETGSSSPWTCTGGSAVVSTPVHSGSHSLQVTPSAGGTGECDQNVTLSPNTAYTLTAWVQGPYAYIGVTGGASANTWSNSASWNQLKVSFTTGGSGAVTVYVHGWYGQSNVVADDFTLG
ncbi:carbohydrate binding domain-containing protein [Streptomyces sp. NPDC101776]|uniref:carbohydrate binding domain-containing protein n=1 Tax=Streptomyces sp. NPDC101776 TaxID=3366146 RepID=UPI00381C9237